jgi:glucan phosphoethanolaminetransferase (alkaline phosphatase superfamily)
MRRDPRRASSDELSCTCSALTMARDTRSCTSKTSSIVPLYFSAQSGVSVSASTS